MVGKVIVGTLIATTMSQEGDSATKTFSFKVTRVGITTGSSSVKYAPQTELPLQAVTMLQKLGLLHLQLVKHQKLIKIVVKGDTTVESNEKFKVNLSNCIGCSIIDNQGIGTIINDDP
jgi:serralysin